MKKTTGNKIRLGIFVSASMILFIMAIYFVGDRQQLFNSTFRISGVFKDIRGLQVGNNVRFSGINIGIVEDIEQVTDSTVKVDMQIEENTRKFIKTDAKAIIGSDGLMGSKLIVIVSGATSLKQISDNDFIETDQLVSMDDILSNLKTTTDNAAMITTDLAIIVASVRDGNGTIGKLLMDSVFADDLGRALVNIKQGAGGFKQNMDAAGHNILLRGYLKKKKKAENKKEEDKEDIKKEEEKKEADKKEVDKKL